MELTDSASHASSDWTGGCAPHTVRPMSFPSYSLPSSPSRARVRSDAPGPRGRSPRVRTYPSPPIWRARRGTMIGTGGAIRAARGEGLPCDGQEQARLQGRALLLHWQGQGRLDYDGQGYGARWSEDGWAPPGHLRVQGLGFRAKDGQYERSQSAASTATHAGQPPPTPPPLGRQRSDSAPLAGAAARKFRKRAAARVQQRRWPIARRLP